MSATGRAPWAWLFATASSTDRRSAGDQYEYALVATQTRALGGTGVHPGEGKKDDPADVAKIGFEAMMKGDGDVVSGLKNKIQSTLTAVTPSGVLARQHGKMAKPGRAKK